MSEQAGTETGTAAGEVPLIDQIAQLERENRELREMLDHHVGAAVAERELAGGADHSGQTRFVAVMFIDLVGSTEMVSTMRPAKVVALLNRFFGLVVEVVERSGGFVNKFIGDEAMIVFGAPEFLGDAAGAALRAARELTEMISSYAELDAGIGVAAGTVLAGNIGSQERYEYTVIGDPVNEAARLTELAKREPGRVLASEYTVAFAEDAERENWTIGGLVELRGRKKLTRLAWPMQLGQ